jgi:hypothetical protein
MILINFINALFIPEFSQSLGMLKEDLSKLSGMDQEARQGRCEAVQTQRMMDSVEDGGFGRMKKNLGKSRS